MTRSQIESRLAEIRNKIAYLVIQNTLGNDERISDQIQKLEEEREDLEKKLSQEDTH